MYNYCRYNEELNLKKKIYYYNFVNCGVIGTAEHFILIINCTN